MEKYGFVYIWRDRKHKRYYIGSHWGTPDDGYICSSTWMRNSYKRRPEDFKRKILHDEIKDRKILYETEQYWFNFIKQEEIGKRYYNLTRTAGYHWSSDSEKSLTIRQKISKCHKGKTVTKETRAKISASNKGKTKAPFSEEHKNNLSLSAKGNTKIPWTEERKKEARLIRMGKKHTEETKLKIREKRKLQLPTFKGRCHSNETKLRISNSLRK